MKIAAVIAALLAIFMVLFGVGEYITCLADRRVFQDVRLVTWPLGELLRSLPVLVLAAGMFFMKRPKQQTPSA